MGKVEESMSDIHFAGLRLDDDARAEAVRHLKGATRVVLVPVADSLTRPNPWWRLPKSIAWVVSDPFQWAAVISCHPLAQRHSEYPLESELAEAFGRQEVMVVDLRLNDANPALPSLTPRDQEVPAWFQDHFEVLDDMLGAPVRSKTDLTALHAGILQMVDHLTVSHEHSQSIEGQGRYHAGDYWHAINHRREPDYGNAKYWFRHVGRHPLLKELAGVVPQLAAEFPGAVQAKTHALVDGGALDPFRFVDLISDAVRRKDQELIRFAGRLQWIEMVGLLEHALRDATAWVEGSGTYSVPSTQHTVAGSPSHWCLQTP